jgi:AcrR family transcriptional regulator
MDGREDCVSTALSDVAGLTGTNLADMTRREQILATAAELFAARGYHGVSVADLGAACGVSGPALYKHFRSKQAVLAEMLVSISEELLRVGRERVTAAAGPGAAIAALVDWHVDFALRHRALIVVQDRDWESLPVDARERVRSLQREYVDLWAGQLRKVHVDLDLPTARAMAHAAFGLINSTPHSGLLPDESMRVVLRRMALGALDTSARAGRPPHAVS